MYYSGAYYLAVGVAVYSVSPVRLLATYGTIPIVGFGMLLSGLVAAGAFPATSFVCDVGCMDCGRLF